MKYLFLRCCALSPRLARTQSTGRRLRGAQPGAWVLPPA